MAKLACTRSQNVQSVVPMVRPSGDSADGVSGILFLGIYLS
jgi:hypothetical protein